MIAVIPTNRLWQQVTEDCPFGGGYWKLTVIYRRIVLVVWWMMMCLVLACDLEKDSAVAEMASVDP